MRAALWVLLLGLTARADAAFDVFLRLTQTSGGNVSGESADPLYSGWIQVTAFESGLSNTVDLAQLGTGRPSLTPITLVKKPDAATPLLFDKLASGTALASAKLVIVLRTPLRVESWANSAQTAYLARQAISVSEGAEPVERLILSLGMMEWSYIQLSPAGDPLAELFASYDQLYNTSTNGSRAPGFPGGVDTDHDGIPDGWALWYFHHRNGQAGDLSRATDDADGDGIDNFHEFLAHTDPTDPQSGLRIVAFRASGDANHLLTWQTVTGLTYRVESAPQPSGPWTLVQTAAASGTGSNSLVIARGPAFQFYRVRTPQ